MGKRQPPTDEEQRIRTLTRELHETIQAARATQRDLAAEMATLKRILEKTAEDHRADFHQQLIDEAREFAERWREDLTTALNQASENAGLTITAKLRETEDLVAKVYGWKSFDDLRDAIVKAVIRRLGMSHLDSIPPLDETAQASMLGLRPQRLPDVVVTTPDMVDEVQKQDPSRIVIDMR